MGFLLFFWPRGRCAARPRSVAGGTPGRRSSRPRSNCRNAEGCPRPRGRRPGCPRPRRRPRRPRRRCPRRRCARPRPPGWARRWPSLAGSSTHYKILRAASSVQLRDSNFLCSVYLVLRRRAAPIYCARTAERKQRANSKSILSGLVAFIETSPCAWRV